MSIVELNQSKTPIIKIDKKLEKYSRKVFFVLFKNDKLRVPKAYKETKNRDN